jgi:hypothetical protein
MMVMLTDAFMWLLPAFVALACAALLMDWSPVDDEADSPDYWIDPEKERSAHLYGKHS